MPQTHPIKWLGRSRRKNFKRAYKEAGLSGPIAMFMLLCVLLPTIVVQRGFTGIAAWEVLLTILLCLSLRMTSEE